MYKSKIVLTIGAYATKLFLFLAERVIAICKSESVHVYFNKFHSVKWFQKGIWVLELFLEIYIHNF